MSAIETQDSIVWNHDSHTFYQKQYVQLPMIKYNDDKNIYNELTRLLISFSLSRLITAIKTEKTAAEAQ